MEGVDSMTYVVIPKDNGYKTHIGKTDNLRLPENAEFFDSKANFRKRLVELEM